LAFHKLEGFLPIPPPSEAGAPPHLRFRTLTRATAALPRKVLAMYYSSGNYEAFARPRKPEGVENKTAWFVGGGLASLARAAFLIRDGQMAGEKITILEELKLPGGALDGLKVPEKGFSSAAAASWKIIWSASGTCSARSRRSRSKAPACWTSSAGSTRTTQT